MSLFLLPDPYGIPLRLQGDLPSSEWPLSLSTEIKEMILSWNKNITDVIANYDLYSKTEYSSKISKLNEEGERISKLVERESSIKVTYYHEKDYGDRLR